MLSRTLSVFGFGTLFATLTACVTAQAEPRSPRPSVECAGATVRDARDAARFYACESIAGNLAIEGTALTDLSDFARIRKVSGTLVIAHNAKLSGISGLAHLESAAAVALVDNPRLENLEGLEQLRHIDRLVVRENGIFETRGLDGLRSVGDLVIDRNPRLLSLSGLNHLRNASSVTVRLNPRLSASFGLLPGLAHVEHEVLLERNMGISLGDVQRFERHLRSEQSLALASER